MITRDWYLYKFILPSHPCPPARLLQTEVEVNRTTANYTTPQTPEDYTDYTHTYLTHIYIDQSKQGPRDYVWAGNCRFCMEHLSTSFYYRLRTRLSLVDSPLAKSRPLFLRTSSIPLFSLFSHPHNDYNRVLVYTLYIYSSALSLFLSLSHTLSLPLTL